MRTRIRLIAVTLLVTVGVFAGVAFASYAHTASQMYDDIYADTENGLNLPDIWIENPSGVWSEEESTILCQKINQLFLDQSDLEFKECEPRLKREGIMFHKDSEGNDIIIPSIWHGIDEGNIDRVWIPNHPLASGVEAINDDEIVVDSRVATGMSISIGDSITIGSGSGSIDFDVVGIGFHSNHLYFAEEGSLFPAEPGTLATGYLTSEGLEKLANLDSGVANLLLIDIQGTPDYDLESTEEIEGQQLSSLLEKINSLLGDEDDNPSSAYSRSKISSVELLRLDAESAMQTYVPVTAMIAIVAGITIFLSLQRLVQSQAREIAILRTLGIPRRVIIPGYILMPLFIGVTGCIFGSIFGLTLGGPAMLDIYEGILGIPILEPANINSIVFQISATAILVVLFSGISPAIQSSKIQPLEILRGQHEVRLSSRRIQKFTSMFPSTVGLTIRSSIRKPVRLLFTFFAVGLSMLIFGSIMVMMESMEESIVGNVRDRQNWDINANIAPSEEQDVIDWANENGANYELMLQFPATIAGDSRFISTVGLDEISTETNSMYGINLKEGNIPSKNSEITQVLIDEGTQFFLDWNIGETQKIMFGSISKEIEISGITQGEITRTIYFHRQDLSPIIGIEATSVLIDLPEGGEMDNQLAQLSIGISQKQDAISSFESILEQQQAIFGSILALGLIIAVVVLFNTLLMNLSERDSEIATLRVLGAPIKRIGSMMLGEHLVIGIIGGISACIFTIAGTQLLLSSFLTWSFYITVSLNLSVTLVLISTVTLISVILTPYGMWRISKMDLVEKIKDFSQ